METRLSLPGEYESFVAELRAAVRASGGSAVVAERAGIPKRTLDGYLLQETVVPTDRAIALMQATSGAGPWGTHAVAHGTVRDDIYALRLDEEIYCKRLQRAMDGGLRIISDNPRYGVDQVSIADLSQRQIEIIGRVVWWGHRNDR